MRVLLDERVNWRLGRDIIGHDVKTAHQMGWTTVQNGALLTLASQHFDVFVTVDRESLFSAKPEQLLNRGYRARSEDKQTSRSEAAGSKTAGGHRLGAVRCREIHRR